MVEVPPGETGGTRNAHRPSEVRLTMTVEEAASAFGICSTFAHEAVKSGDIPKIQIGRRILAPMDRLLAGEPPPLDGSALAQGVKSKRCCQLNAFCVSLVRETCTVESKMLSSTRILRTLET